MSDVLSAGSPDRFGYEWDRYSEIRPDYEEQFRRWTVHLPPDDWRGKIFLDVGCGTGRNSYWPMTYGAAGGKAIDVDEASLAVARRNLGPFATMKVEEKSAYEIGESDAYDIVFSIGVIHHLQFPERALAAMARAAKPGGRVLIWVYGYENNEWIVRFFDPAPKGAVQPAADRAGASSVAVPDRGAVAGAAAGNGTHPLFPSAAPAGVCACALDRLRPDAAQDRALLAARDGRGAARRGRSHRYKAQLGQRDVVVGNRHQATCRRSVTGCEPQRCGSYSALF